MRCKACYITNTGKVRELNEDGLLLDGLVICETSMEEHACRVAGGEKLLFIVADGMGGHAKGETASRETLLEFSERARKLDSAADILSAIMAAKSRLNEVARADRGALGLGATLAGILFHGPRATVFNCGDSRVYRLKKAMLERISKDHSLVQELVDRGLLSEREMRSHPQKNIVTSAVIGDLSGVAPRIFFREIEVGEREIFLLCTDGLWESLDTDSMEECLAGEDPEAAVGCLFSRAISGRAQDNVSIITLEVRRL